MKDQINSIDMNTKIDHEGIYNLFKTRSSKTNKKISEKIHIFKHNIDFFEFYSNKDIKNLLNIFGFELSGNNDESLSLFTSDIERYITCISHIILSIKLILKIKDILTKIIVDAKNHLLKLKYENKLENYYHDYLFLYLESLLKISENNPKFYLSVSKFENTPKDSLFRKFISQHNIEGFSSIEIEPILYNNPPTPKFESESEKEIENQNNENINLENSNENNPPINNESVLTLSKYVFAEEPFASKNLESKLISSPIVQSKIKNIPTKDMVKRSGNLNNHKNKRGAFSETDLNIKNKKKNKCRILLEMINKIYKNGSINSEEKLELKQLVVEKSKKIEYFYYNIYKNSKKDKNILRTEVKKLIN